MKKQNANNKLAFNKTNVTELNDENMLEVQAGTSTVFCSIAVTVVLYSIVRQLQDQK